MRNIPTISHSGEVSGFLASNTVFSTRNGAVVVLSNEDGIDLTGPLSQRTEQYYFSRSAAYIGSGNTGS